MIKFEATGCFTLGGRGRVFTGPCPLDGRDDASDLRKRVGEEVEIDGVSHRILGIEAKALVRPPRLGEPVAVLVAETDQRAR
jgi:hypothetical protein